MTRLGGAMATYDLSVSMNDIMDVVTLYKCKFCDFSCSQPQGISQHVQQVHMQPQPPSQPPEKPKQAQENVRMVSLLNNTSHLKVAPPAQGGDGLDPPPALVTAPPERTTADEMCGPDALQTATLETLGDSLHVEAVDDAGAAGLAVNKEVYLCGQCNLGFDTIDNCKNHMVHDHNLCMDAQEAVPSLLRHEDGGEGEVEGQEEEAMAVEVHVPGEVLLPPNKVSVGTQVMTRKKPGRKRKSRAAADDAAQPPPSQASQEEEFYEAINMEAPPDLPLPDGEENVDEEDMEEEEGEQPSGVRTRRRRRRLPARLANIYYLGRRTLTPTVRQPPPPRIKVEPFKLRCPKTGCTARFQSQSSLDLHMECHLPDVASAAITSPSLAAAATGRKRSSATSAAGFRCVQCPHSAPQWRAMRLHLWREHGVDTDLYSCDQCDFKSDMLIRLERHAQIHSEARPYVCDVCGKGFKQATQLHNHKAVHADRSDSKWYTNRHCNICKRTFANKKCLKNHIETIHGKEKPFSCPYCSHVTSRKAILDLHIRTHTGEKPFKCDMCTYMTGDHNSLRRHKMRHTGEKPYKCRYCPYSAIQAISLKTHMKNKHADSEGVFACRLCPYHTVNEQYYNQHQADHRLGLVPADKPARGSDLPAGRPATTPAAGTAAAAAVCQVAPSQILTLPAGQQHITVQAPPGVKTRHLSAAELLRLVNSGVEGDNTAQLIYTALNALSQQGGGGGGGGSGQAKRGGVQGTDDSLAVQPTVHSSTQGGVTTHTITFNIPPSEQQPGDQVAAEAVKVGEQPQQQQQQVLLAMQPVQVTEEPSFPHGVPAPSGPDQVQHTVIDTADVNYVSQETVQESEVQGIGDMQGQMVMKIAAVDSLTQVTAADVPTYEAPPTDVATYEATGTDVSTYETAPADVSTFETAPTDASTYVSTPMDVSTYVTAPTDASYGTTSTDVSAYVTTPTDVSSYVTAASDVTTYEVTHDGDGESEVVATPAENLTVESCPTEVVLTNTLSTEVAEVNLGETMVMKVVDAEGNIAETQIQYVTVAEENTH